MLFEFRFEDGIHKVDIDLEPVVTLHATHTRCFLKGCPRCGHPPYMFSQAWFVVHELHGLEYYIGTGVGRAAPAFEIKNSQCSAVG